MKVETIGHESGDLLPLLLNKDGLPIVSPNEFIISRRNLSPNTLVRNSRELAILYGWLEREKIDLEKRVKNAFLFKEAEIKGGLIESLKRDQERKRRVKKISVKPHTFNQRLTTTRQYLSWYYDVAICSLPLDSKIYNKMQESKSSLLSILDNSFINAPPVNRISRKGLNSQEMTQLIQILDPGNSSGFGQNPAVRHRNYVATMIMLYFGLRPGELLSLRVEDIEIGAISSIRVRRIRSSFCNLSIMKMIVRNRLIDMK